MTDEEWAARVESLRNRVNTEGIKNIATEQGYRDLLHVVGTFHHDSFDNAILISIQNPNATFLATYGRYSHKFDRQVLNGEKAIHTISYAPDFSTEPVLARDGKGNPIVPVWGGRNDSIKYTLLETAKFRDTKLFDISQTKGKEIPNLAQSVKVEPEAYEDLCASLMKISPVPVYTEDFSKRPGLVKARDWAYDPENKCLYVKDFMSPGNTAKALISGISRASMPEASAFEVDSAAYAVCDKLGIDTKHLESLFENIDKKIQSRIQTRSGASTLNEFKQNMEENVMRTVSDIVEGTVGEMALLKERKELNYEKEAEVFGIPALYTSKLMSAGEVPEGMYAYKVIGSHFNEKTGQVGGPFCLTDLDNEKADVNIGGTIVLPKYITLNERGFLRLGENDLAFVDTGPLKDTLNRLTNSDLKGILDNRIIQSNEEVLWTDHGSRFALYHVNDDVPYKNMPNYELNQKFYEIVGEDYHMVYGARPGNEETLKEFLGQFESGSKDAPVDFRGHALSVGDVVVINQYGRVSAAMVDHDGTLVDLPYFAKERYEVMCQNGTNTSLESYMENGGLKDCWTQGEKDQENYLNFSVYTRKQEDGKLDCQARITTGDGRTWTKDYGTDKIPNRDTVMLDFQGDVPDRGQEKPEKPEKPEHRELSKLIDKNRQKIQEKERNHERMPSIFMTNSELTHNR